MTYHRTQGKAMAMSQKTIRLTPGIVPAISIKELVKNMHESDHLEVYINVPSASSGRSISAQAKQTNSKAIESAAHISSQPNCKK